MARSKNGPWSPIYGQAWTHQQTRRSSAVVRERVRRPTTAEVAPFLILGWLNRINVWCLANDESGGIAGLSNVLLATVAWPEAIEGGRRPADIGALIRDALHAGGFLDGSGEDERVHNFGRHHARLLKDRNYRRSDDESGDESGDNKPDTKPDSSGDQSGDTEEERRGDKKFPSETTAPPPGDPPPVKPRVTSPTEAAARALAKALGSSVRPCRDQVAALTRFGWDVPRIEAAIAEHAAPGVSPWDWTKLARGVAGGAPKSGLDTVGILAWGASDGGRKAAP